MIRTALLALLLVAASHRERNADAYLRQGDIAAKRGKWAEAALLYEKAEMWASDPGLVAFNLATARYHLAESDPRELGGAEAGFRACLKGPRRGRALIGLGNCLLLRAAGSLDAVTLRAAIDRFSDALAVPDEPDVKHHATARHNRERARLLLLQSRARPDAPQENPEEPPPNEDDGKDPKPTPKQKDAADVKSDGPGKKVGGKGMLPPVPIDKDAPPLGGEDATLHLDDAERRIAEEWRAYRRSRARPAATGRDW